MKQLMIVLCLFLIVFCGHAQEKKKKERKISLHGIVVDSRTKAGVDSVLVTIMRADSTVVDTVTARSRQYDWEMRSSTRYSREIPAVVGRYIIKAEAKGYKPGFTNTEIKTIGRNRFILLSAIRMQPLSTGGDIDGGSLDEFVVKATRIKMVNRGDTIVFNADAFNLEAGSMLDALIRQLPGAQLSSDGEIIVNGEKIEELTLNGRDFFKGNNKVMLENLPSFTVKNIEVYRKTSDMDKWRGSTTEKKALTMDVKLKREYNTGLLGNAEAAVGTSERYLGRFFGMRYTDCSRLSAFANINNVNEERRPGSNGDWDPTKTVPGQKTMRTAGIDLLIDEKEHRWKEEGSVMFSSTSTDDVNRSNAEHYTTAGSNFSRSMSTSDSRDNSLRLNNTFDYLKSMFMVYNSVNMNYTQFRSNSISRSAASDIELNKWGDVQSSLDSVFASSLSPELQAKLINRTANRGKTKSEYFTLASNLQVAFKAKAGDIVSMSGNVNYDNNSSKNFNQQNIGYFRNAGTDMALNKYNTTPRHSLYYGFNFDYRFMFSSDFQLGTSIGYSQNSMTSNNEYYLLDRLSGWGTDGTHAIGELPSNHSDMVNAMDAGNSFNYDSRTQTVTVAANPSWGKSNDDFSGWGNLWIPLKYEYKKMDYFSTKINDNKHSRTWLFTPALYVYLNWKKRKLMFNINARYECNSPDLLQKIDRRNDENPLYVRLGNPDLKGNMSESVDLWVEKGWKKRHELTNRVGVAWYAEQRAVSQGYTYDPKSGVYTFRPVNVDGNWNIKFSDYTNVFFGESKKWSINHELSYQFVQSVDMAMTAGSTDSGISQVHTNSVYDALSVNYNFKDLTVSARGNVNYRHSTSERSDFETVNATNYSYGLECTYKIPWLKTTIATDIKMYSRRGYSSKEYNTDDLIWNASLSKPLFKGRLTAVLEAYDILHQMTNTNIFINAQGRTENFTNTLPRYAMLHLRWNFNKMPKAKVSKR